MQNETKHTAKTIKNANPSGKMTMVSGTNQIVFDNGVTFTTQTSKEKTNLWNKLKRMGFEQHYNFSSDENEGIAEAGRIGQNPFAFRMICAYPSRNGFYK
jgi:hypothetical protein